LFVDTSAFYAFFDQSDGQHGRVVQALQPAPEDLLTSNYTLDELTTLLRVRNFEMHQFQEFISSLWKEDACQVLRATADIDLEAWEMRQKFADQRFSFTVCTSFVLMKRLKLTKVCSLDADSPIAGFVLVI